MSTSILRWTVGAVLALTLAVWVVSIASFAQVEAATLTPITVSLDVGSRGPAVTTLQTLLASSATVYPAGLVTGYYGPMTRNAVIQFQIANNLPPVGRVGPLTRELLNSVISGNGVIDVDAPAIYNLQVNKSGTSAFISWNTTESALGRIHYSTSPIVMTENTTSKTEPVTSGTVLTEQTSGTTHSLNITGLTSGQTYYFSTAANDSSQNVAVTLPSSFVAP